MLAALLLGAAAAAVGRFAQQATITQTIAGTRLDIMRDRRSDARSGRRDHLRGVVARSATASGALQDTADRMERVLAALKRAGVADRDIQTSNVSLNPEYRYPENQSPQLVGYTASNSVTVRFRDIRKLGQDPRCAGRRGCEPDQRPNLSIDKPEAALDEARAQGRSRPAARAPSFMPARSGMRVARIVSVSESGGNVVRRRRWRRRMVAVQRRPATKIEPGEQKLQVSLAMTFELQ